jgi:DNA-binding MurR/RpiR family transcriptional regulator
MLKNAFLFSNTPLPKLTETQRKILSYLLDHMEDVAYMSSAVLAKKLNISNATIVRFSQRIGFRGYLDLQRHIREKIKSQLNLTDRIQKSSRMVQSPGYFLKTVLESDRNNLTHAMKSIPEEVFETVVRHIHTRKEIWVVGLRSCHGAAHYFATNLGYLGRRVNLINLDAGTVWSKIQPGLCPESLLISMTLPRYCRQTLDITRQFHDAGSTIAAITDSPASPLAAMADHVFSLPFWVDSFFESNVAVVSLLNAVLSAVSYLDGHKTVSHLTALETVWERNNIYCDTSTQIQPSWAGQLKKDRIKGTSS